MNQDRNTLKLCAECGNAAKYVRKDADGTPFRYLCSKCTGVHRRIASSYRSSKWTTEYHEGAIDGIVELSAVEKAESVLNFAAEKKRIEEEYWAKQNKKAAERKRHEILTTPAWLRERVKNYHWEQENTNFTRKVEVRSDSYGVEINLMNWNNIKSRKHAEDLIVQLKWVLQQLDEETVKWESEMSDKIVAADAAKQALEAEEGVTSDRA
jgi:ribosomal protein L24E